MNTETSKRRVLFLIPSLRGGGAERVIVTLLKHLDSSGFQLTIAVVDFRKAAFRDDIPPDVELIDLGVARVRYALPKIAALIWKRRPDVVFSTLGHLNLALAMIRPLLPNGVRYVARETSIVSFTLQTYRLPAVWRALYRRFYKRHDLVVCQSRYMENDLVEQFGYPRTKSVVINNPLDTERIRKLAAAPIDQSIPHSGRINLVAAGRMTDEKGFDLLIEAIARLADPTICLFILGEGPLLGDLKRLVVARGVADQVEFVGFQPNPYAWLARADAFVLSSRYDGFPNVVLEALACGTPVVATPAPGGIREILDGIPECVVASEVSARSLADAISHWLRGTRKRVESGAIAPYTLERIVGRYQQVLG